MTLLNIETVPDLEIAIRTLLLKEPPRLSSRLNQLTILSLHIHVMNGCINTSVENRTGHATWLRRQFFLFNAAKDNAVSSVMPVTIDAWRALRPVEMCLIPGFQVLNHGYSWVAMRARSIVEHVEAHAITFVLAAANLPALLVFCWMHFI